MRLIALLSWFDERTDWLAELVASMGRADVDHVVALDGAYSLYPGARGSSGSEQASVITSTALGAGMGATVHVPEEPWEDNETGKRTALFRLGHAIAEPGDWFWVCDADEVITNSPDLRGSLEDTELDVGEVILWERDEYQERSHCPIRKLFRFQSSGIRVVGHHACYLAGDDVLWDAACPGRQVEAEALWDVRVQHRAGDRDLYRNEHRNTYYGRRARLKVEA